MLSIKERPSDLVRAAFLWKNETRLIDLSRTFFVDGKSNMHEATRIRTLAFSLKRPFRSLVFEKRFFKMTNRQTFKAGAVAVLGIAALIGVGAAVKPASAATLLRVSPAVQSTHIYDNDDFDWSVRIGSGDRDDHDWRWHRDHDRYYRDNDWRYRDDHRDWDRHDRDDYRRGDRDDRYGHRDRDDHGDRH